MVSEQNIRELIQQLDSRQQKIAEELYSGNQQMRTLAKRVWRVQEDERKHIARELHDGVGQQLTALINQLTRLQQEHPAIEMAPSVELARQALADTREISRLMRPRILDDLGLVPALEWLCRVMGEKNGIEILLQHNLMVALDDEKQTLAFRVIQEALTNAVKHACCTRITVNVMASEQLFFIKIKDNGKGLSQDELNSIQGFGLSSMHDRVMAFGGQLLISSEPGEGCEIKVMITAGGEL